LASIFTALLEDREAAGLLDDRARAQAMVRVEVELALAQAELGLIAPEAAAAIERTLATFEPDLDDLARGTAEAGVPVPAQVAQLRQAVGPPHADQVHRGATSQDIVDTALVLQLRAAADRLRGRLEALAAALGDLVERHRAAPMLARTRFQQAVPTRFGLKAAMWLDPLERHRIRLEQLAPRLFVVQLGGSAGNLAAFGTRGVATMMRLAERLELAAPPAPWHSQRDALGEFGAWLALVSGSLGKLGQDVLLLAQTEVGELRVAGGGSSTMPQKSNAVAAEALVTGARRNAGLAGTLLQAMVHAHERDGTAWTLEWSVLPDMVETTAAGLRVAGELLDAVEVDTARMAAAIEANFGLAHAEALSFALAERLPRAEAQALVRAACDDARVQGIPLPEALRRRLPAGVGPDLLVETQTGDADGLIERILAARRR